ncbi:MAG: hypothetical protein BRC44_08215 [Cyanobacteria bacterium QS_4_48_99]|nr:MAG: hypothetical protein BRC44_08215 [Cyanobacteria bacterium QS_4_48_99]PSO84353.1 MAG: hypothetical protein BRC45_06000 [Cyanobacteria bacterium QS_5_48_63]
MNNEGMKKAEGLQLQKKTCQIRKCTFIPVRAVAVLSCYVMLALIRYFGYVFPAAKKLFPWN